MMMTEKSIYAILLENAETAGDKIAYINDEEKYTWSEVYELVNNLIGLFQGWGITKESTAVLFFPRSIDSPFILLALRAIGVLCVLFAPESQTEEDKATIKKQFPNCYLFGEKKDENQGDWWCEFDGKSKIFNKKTKYEACVEKKTLIYDNGEKSAAFVIYTSGSTGAVKGVLLREYGLIYNATHEHGRLGGKPDDIMMCVAPLHHVVGIIIIITNLIYTSAIFFAKSRSPEYVIERIEKYRCTRIDGVPTFFLMLIEKMQERNADLSSLRGGVLAGSSYTPKQFMKIENALGIRLCSSYGMTETSTAICNPHIDDPIELRSKSVGHFVQGMEGVFKTASGGRITEAYQEGEICVKSCQLMIGYLSDDGTIDPHVDEEGYFHTGDLGYYDEQGNVYITGRCKDIIIRGGENLSPRRIEEIITDIKDVKNACVVGIENEKYGEIVGALVVTESYDVESLMRILRERLRKCEVPAKLVISREMPLGKTGKPDKKEVRRLLENGK